MIYQIMLVPVVYGVLLVSLINYTMNQTNRK